MAFDRREHINDEKRGRDRGQGGNDSKGYGEIEQGVRVLLEKDGRKLAPNSIVRPEGVSSDPAKEDNK